MTITAVKITCNSGHEHSTFAEFRACSPAPVVKPIYRVVDLNGKTVHMAVNGNAKTVCGISHNRPESLFPIKAKSVPGLLALLSADPGEKICKRCQAYSY